ncbi:HET-domain-containing protein [Byssothecium circinans]|uniref:HET-domain-containing protein n=1 Tax=Byssothecium circinans TaxID=147558 RepID=A0A6A5TK21_9PLEO|nr:HET-domain-containing protein [Byssothecium circinans]
MSHTRDKFFLALVSTAVVLSVSAFTYFVLDRIRYLDERQRAMEDTATDLANNRRHKSSFSPDDDTYGDEIARISLLLSRTYSSWLRRGVMIRWAIQPGNSSSFEEMDVWEDTLDDSDNQLDILPENQKHSPLCRACISRLTSGQFRARRSGVPQHARVLSLFYNVNISAIHRSAAKTGCTICKMISGTLQDAENFVTHAKTVGFSDEECFGMSTFFVEAVNVLTISLNLYGTIQCIMELQMEIYNEVKTRILGPYFRLFLDRSSSPFDGIKSQPPITELASSEALNQAKTWLEDCDERHMSCFKQGTYPLPSRILDVTLENPHGFIKLVESSGLSGAYVALSYCWGQDQKTTLTRKTFKEFLNGVAMDSLPQTILDAIEVTRKLCIKYLWIDALCIIQDSQDDKLHEIARMDAVYSNSYVTISAASAASASTGFLQPRPPLYVQPLRMPLRLQPGDGNATLVMYDDFQMDQVGVKNSPIERRGWTLQVKVLSRRVLFYGATHLQWMCRSIPLESGPTDVLQASFLTDSYKPVHFSGNQPRDLDPTSNILKGWEVIIMQLSRRLLTYPEDALRAVAGVAARYQKELRDKYVAGLWRRALVRELLWHGHLEHDPMHLQPRSIRYIAPSWSWASRVGEIFFPPYQQDATLSTIVITDCCIVLKDSASPFGDIIDGHIAICAPVKKARLVSHTLFDLRPEIDKIEGCVYIDSREDLHSKFCQSRTVVEEFDVVLCLRLTNEMGLVLKRVHIEKHTRKQEAETYRRVGCFQSYSEEWLSDCRDQQIVIV